MADKFTLPRLRVADPISGADGRAVPFLIRIWDQLCRAIETNENNQNEILARLVAAEEATAEAQAAADAAQTTADAALAMAENGSKAGQITTVAGAASGSVEFTDVLAGSLIDVNGRYIGGSLDTNVDWEGEATLTESDGTSTNTLGTVEITATPDGIVLPGPTYGVRDSQPAIFSVFGTLSGAVEYTLTITRTGGSEYVVGAVIEASVKVTPSA